MSRLHCFLCDLLSVFFIEIVPVRGYVSVVAKKCANLFKSSAFRFLSNISLRLSLRSSPETYREEEVYEDDVHSRWYDQYAGGC